MGFCLWLYYLQQCEQEKKDFFDCLLSQGEGVFERLHQCANRELSKYLEAECSSDDFLLDFGTKLAKLTRATGKYLANLVASLENGIADVAPSSNTIKQE